MLLSKYCKNWPRCFLENKNIKLLTNDAIVQQTSHDNQITKGHLSDSGDLERKIMNIIYIYIITHN